MPCASHKNGRIWSKIENPSKAKSPTSDNWDVNRPLYRKWGREEIWRQGGQVCHTAILIYRQVIALVESGSGC